MAANAVPGFKPSEHGFRFANAFPPGPTVTFGPLDPRLLGIGDASAGLCGGMVLTVRDLYEAGIAPPTDTSPPANGSPRFRALVRRQVQSLDWLRVPLRYFDLQAFRPDPPDTLSRLLHRDPARLVAVRDEWPRIRAEIDGGRLPVIGLVRSSSPSPWALSRNHQVLGYGYEGSDRGFRIRVYDPNHPSDDTVELVAAPVPDAGPATGLQAEGDSVGWTSPERIGLSQTTGERLLGFFLQPYPPPGPPTVWR